MAIGDDFEIQNDADIRHVSGSATYTVLELHRWLQDLADDAAASGDDLVDITKATPSERSTDSYITLLNGFNIDDTAAQYLYGGSIVQAGGDVIYDGIKVIAAPGMYLNILQNGALATNFWTTGLNADAAAGLSHQFLLKVRTGGADIDGRRIIGTTREWGFTYSEFKVNGTSRGENVLALMRLVGSNNNIFDVENGILVQNNVQVIAQNSAGLIVGAGAAPSDVWQGHTVEGALTPEHMLRLILSAVSGKLAIDSGTGVVTTRDVADTKDRLTVLTDDDGQRLSVTRDAS